MDTLNIAISIISIVISILAIILTIKYKQLSDKVNEDTKNINFEVLNNLSYMSNISIPKVIKQTRNDNFNNVEDKDDYNFKIISNEIISIKKNIIKHIHEANWTKLTQLYNYYSIIIDNNRGIESEIKKTFDLIIIDLSEINKGFVAYNYSDFKTIGEFENRIYNDNLRDHFEILTYGLKYIIYNKTSNEELKRALKRHDDRKISELNLNAGDLIILKIKI